jgi:hypothetical protein
MGIGCGVAGLAISAFAKADTPAPAATASMIGKIKLESAVPAAQTATLQGDRKIFDAFNIPETDTALKTLLGTASNSASDLDAWLETRVQVIVSEGYVASKNTVFLAASYKYPNPGIFPIFETPPASSSSTDKDASNGAPPAANILMSNFGFSTYYGGKASGRLLGLVVDGVGTLPVHSPLVGAIQVGAALFNPIYFVDGAHPEAPANSILRLGTFFHEAHHSDGNGKTLGFFHAICPAGHSYPGLGACDRSTNGPYTVGGQIMKSLTESCKSCTVAQVTALRLQYLDSFDRVLPYELDGVTPIKAWDARPEGAR